MSSTDPVADWDGAVANFADFVAGVRDWSVASPCPGWTIADLVSHSIDLESMLAIDPRPDHTPDWSRLAHVTSDFGRFTEVGVDYRRGRSSAELLDELQATHARAHSRIDPLALDDTIPWLRGETPVSVVLGMRTFDLWVHEQDARSCTGHPGNLTGPGSANAMQFLSSSLPKVWGRSVSPPVGSVLHVAVEEPGLTGEFWIRMGDDGKAGFTEPCAATTSVSMPWSTFVMLGSGRAVTDDLTATVTVEGDAALGRSVLRALAVTP